MTMRTPVETIEQLVAALAAQDLQATLALYKPDAYWEFHVPGWDAAVRGTEQIASRYIPWFINHDSYEIVGYQVIGQGGTVALRWEQQWRDDRDGAPCTCHQSHFFQVDDGDGLIQRHWMYCSGVTVWELAQDEEAESHSVAHG